MDESVLVGGTSTTEVDVWPCGTEEEFWPCGTSTVEEAVWPGGTLPVDEIPVDSDVRDSLGKLNEATVDSEDRDPAGKLDDALSPLLLALGYTGEYSGGAEYWRGRICFSRFTALVY